MDDKGEEMGMENTEKCVRTGTDYKVLNVKLKQAKRISTCPVRQRISCYLFASDFCSSTF